MEEKPILIKKGHEIKSTERPGKLYRLIINSQKIEGIIAELEPHAESKWFIHQGEEIHLVLQGEMEYLVGEDSYRLSEGDILWHKSNLKHKAKNISKEKLIYVTIGTPPTFMFDNL
jgi:quercetin dioxygenase-like cupin family protein